MVEILYFPVTQRVNPEPPPLETFVTVCHGSRDPPSPSIVTYLLNGPVSGVYITERPPNARRVLKIKIGVSLL